MKVKKHFDEDQSNKFTDKCKRINEIDLLHAPDPQVFVIMHVSNEMFIWE